MPVTAIAMESNYSTTLDNPMRPLIAFWLRFYQTSGFRQGGFHNTNPRRERGGKPHPLRVTAQMPSRELSLPIGSQVRRRP